MNSPFVEGRQRFWDSTSIGWLLTCPRKYQLTMLLGYRTKAESVHLRFGSLYHSSLESYDKLRASHMDHESALIEVVTELMRATWDDDKPWESGHNSKTRETLVRSVIWYLEQFKDDPTKTIILSDGRPAVELTFQMPFDDNYSLCGHLDRVVDFVDGRYVTDRKTTTSTISSNYFDQFVPDTQMSLYTIAAEVVFSTPVRGIIIDAAQIAVGFTRFARGFTARTKTQLNEWLDNIRHWFEMAERFHDKGFWPMNDKSCHQYGGCPFRKVCSKSPEVREIFLNSDYVQHPWNPLDRR